ncbi:hypothetical protein AB1Y20_001092 [Prymnesium parvum]|uniref:Mitochondrial carrier protein n=1 Tax=Prymnesium parvum TaxID=97485 RepID=A0AB34JFM5_PRYPA
MAGLVGTLVAFPFEALETRQACAAANSQLDLKSSGTKWLRTGVEWSVASSILGNAAFFTTMGGLSLINVHDPLVRALAASAAATLINQPCQVLKTVAIASERGAAAASPLELIRGEMKVGGPASFWTRGGILPMSSAIAGTTIQWTLYAMLMANALPTTSNSLVSAETSPQASAVAGAIASAATTFIMHPLNLIKTNLLLEKGREPQNFFQVCQRIVKSNGIRGLYLGIEQAQLRSLVPAVCNFFTLPLFARLLGAS